GADEAIVLRQGCDLRSGARQLGAIALKISHSLVRVLHKRAIVGHCGSRLLRFHRNKPRFDPSDPVQPFRWQAPDLPTQEPHGMPKKHVSSPTLLRHDLRPQTRTRRRASCAPTTLVRDGQETKRNTLRLSAPTLPGPANVDEDCSPQLRVGPIPLCMVLSAGKVGRGAVEVDWNERLAVEAEG